MSDPNMLSARKSHSDAAPLLNGVRSGFASLLREGLGTILGAMLIALLVRSLAYEPFNIPSESMMSRLLVGDYLFVSKWPYGYSRHSLPFGLPPVEGRLLSMLPERGDVVVFKSPRDNRTDFIKRVVGLPGDRVQMRDGQLILNGVPVSRTRLADFQAPAAKGAPCIARSSDDGHVCTYTRYLEILPSGRGYEVLDAYRLGRGDDTAEFVVPEDHVFVMGDNRDNSADSRFPLSEDGVGFVPVDNLVGKAAFMFFSTDGTAEIMKPWTWLDATRWSRIGTGF